MRDNHSRDGAFWHHWQRECQDSGQEGLRTPTKTITGKTFCFRPVGSISIQFPTRGTLSDKSPPRTTSHLFARAVPVSNWDVGHNTRRDPETQASTPRRMGDRFPKPCRHTSWQPAWATGLDRSLNTTLLNYAAITSQSSLALQHVSSARGTQAPPTTSSGLYLGLNMAG
jgi:hypothetical protein